MLILQKRRCPTCGEVIEFYVHSTWQSHLEWCRVKNRKKEEAEG